MGEAFIKAAAAAGVTRLGAELEELVALEAAHGRNACGRTRPGVRVLPLQGGRRHSILAAGQARTEATGTRASTRARVAQVPTRSLAEYAPTKAKRHEHRSPRAPGDLEAGLRRLNWPASAGWHPN